MEVEFTLYRGFLIAKHSDSDVKAYRSRISFAEDLPSYKEQSSLEIASRIDETKDHGYFNEAGYNEVMKILGRDVISTQPVQEKKYQVSPDGVLLRDVLEAMENIARAEGYGPLEGSAIIDQIMREQHVTPYYKKNRVEGVLKLALNAGFVYEV